MRVQLFTKAAVLVAAVDVDANVEAVFYDGPLFVLRDGVFKEAVLADQVVVLETPL